MVTSRNKECQQYTTTPARVLEELAADTAQDSLLSPLLYSSANISPRKMTPLTWRFRQAHLEGLAETDRAPPSRLRDLGATSEQHHPAQKKGWLRTEFTHLGNPLGFSFSF